MKDYEYFVHLHTHSVYSIRDGLIDLNTLESKLQEIGQNAIAITDHGILTGSIIFKLIAKNVKPIVGCEFYVEFEGKNLHQIILAKNRTGFNNLIKLNNLAQQNFYKAPRLKFEWILENADGLILTSSCANSIYNRLLLQNRHELAIQYMLSARSACDFYIELQANEYHENAVLNEILMDIAKKYKIRCIATNDCHYIAKDHAKLHDIVLKQRSEEWEFDCKDLYLKTGEEIATDLRWSYNISADYIFPHIYELVCSVEDYSIIDGELKLPKIDKYNIYEICMNRIKELGLSQEYINRLNMEYQIMTDYNALSYINIVYDVVKFAKDNNIIVGPGRGSAVGSLVLYLLGITEIDPIKHDLIFERFLSPSRAAKLLL